MTNKRFVYSHSNVYGWTVYDRQRGSSPAFEACYELLPPVKVEQDGTTIMESPILIETEYKAMKLCMKLNHALKNVKGGASI